MLNSSFGETSPGSSFPIALRVFPSKYPLPSAPATGDEENKGV
jgi:hypothetical protein